MLAGMSVASPEVPAAPDRPWGRRAGDAVTNAARAVREHPLAALFVVVAVVVRLGFLFYTRRVWEDAYITITPVRNLYDGKGLVHHSSEPGVQSFTSALSILVPIVGYAFGRPLALLRLASLVSAGVAVVYAYRISRRLGVHPVAIAFVLAYLAFDYQQVFFGMGGMETQMATAVLLAGAYYVLDDRPRAAGVCAGLAVLARPDFVLWAGVAALAVAWPRADRRNRVVRFGVPAALIVAPWVIFTTLYYGSPVPNTIRAKNLYPGTGLSYSPSVDEIVNYLATWWKSLAPFYENPLLFKAPWPVFLLKLVVLAFLGLAAGGLWAHRRRRGVLAIGAVVLLWAAYRTRALLPTYFTWYIPPFAALAAVLAGAGLDRLHRIVPRLSAVVAGLLAFSFAAHIPYAYPLEKRVQRDVEQAVRERVGNYLHDNMGPDDTVVLEPVGYIGWSAGDRTTYDYPGLTSRRVVEVLEDAEPAERGLWLLTKELKPDWIVLRPLDLPVFEANGPEVLDDYREVARFESPPDLSLANRGLEYLTIDNVMIIYKRK